MKKLLLALLTTLSFSAFAESQEICRLDIYKSSVMGEMDGKVIKAKRINSDQVPLKITTFPQDIVILRDADQDVLAFYEESSLERSEYKDLLSRSDVTETPITISIYKRYIYSKVYLSIKSGKLSLDLPVVSDQKISLTIPMGKDVYLRCEN